SADPERGYLFFSSRRRHTSFSRDWSSDVCSSDLFAQEAQGMPRMWMTGVAKGDFVDENNKPIPQFEAYFDAIHMLTKETAKVGQIGRASCRDRAQLGRAG